MNENYKKIIDKLKCFICLDELEGEEIDSPREDDNGNVICDDCHSYRYEMICPLCEDGFDIRDFKHDKNVWIVIPEKDCEGESIQPGLYSGQYENFNYDEYITGFGYLPEDRELKFIKKYSSKKIEYSRFLCFDCGERVKCSNNPFCEACKENDCMISLDGTCEMIRIYQKAKKL